MMKTVKLFAKFNKSAKERLLKQCQHNNNVKVITQENNSYFKNKSSKKMPQPKGWPIIGTTLSLIAAGGARKLHLYVNERHKELGPVYREKIGPTTAVFVADADEMRKVFSLEGRYPKHHLPEAWLLYNEIYGCKRGLLFMDNEEWLHFRRIMNNTMLKLESNEIVQAVDPVADLLIQKWKKSEKIENLNQELYKWSLDVLLSVLIGPSTYTENYHDLTNLIQILSSSVHNVFIQSAKLSLMPASFAVKVKLPVWKKFVHSVDSAIDGGNRLVEAILPLANIKNEGLISKFIDAKIETEYLKRIVTDLILAAGDTTAYTTQWLMYSLAKNQAAQTKISKEIRLAKKSQDFLQSNLLRGALREALRMYPVAPFLTRVLPSDANIGGYHVSAGELILLSLYTSGRDERYFPEANQFQPIRWTRDQNGYLNVKNSYASIPFAMGARSCIGKRIAEIQILITVAKMLQNLKLETDKSEVEMVLQLISVPDKPISILLKKQDF